MDRRKLSCACALACLMLCIGAAPATADTITINGQITQSTSDQTGPAVNNPSLNDIQDSQPYTLLLTFLGSITNPGLYSTTGGTLPGASLVFSVPAAPSTENSFGPISLSITANGSFDDVSLLGCLTTGSDCFAGNQLTANFRIPATDLNSLNVPATELDQPHPLDLLEDDSTTDIQGSITTYSYARVTAVPEPAPAGPLALVLASLAAVAMKSSRLSRR